ncbi:MAG TPA: class I SAM-dependent methyltransferase [Solirubrobacteraceae bacterium]|jgi:2-polyprenyl-3-methyl-5-hydroxy-6-metoxy-1,4-benzoquinol methylase|nr:class I SAM-dependent methyltransferase [Solirubrobacteraceae bacterium]
MSAPHCRFCGAALEHPFVDLGSSPLANSYIPSEREGEMEPFYPLRALVCGNCFLVQLEEFETPERIFSDYAYFSSYSASWVEHARRYAERMVESLELGPESQVVEIASNDGYLLQHFHERGIPVLGVEPAANVAEAAIAKGIPTLVRFFGRRTASSIAARGRADLLLGNNVLAHVPDLGDFVAGMKELLAPGGTITMEFPHLMRLMEDNQWDTIYHEHFSYFSFLTASRVFAAYGLRLFDVEELPTHGGSLRVYGAHADDRGKPESARALELREREREAGYERIATYTGYGARVEADKRRILQFLIALKNERRRVVGYGAPAKGNTLLNYCGVRRDFLDYTVDLSPHKQGRLLPGSHIPIRAPDAIREDRPDVVVILPWNLKDEIMEQLGFIGEWGGRFAARTPELALLS